MTGHGQFCAVARALDALGGRWTLLIVRELLCGSRRFNDIRRGVPRVSRTVLSERLQALVALGAVARVDGAQGPEYAPTAAGRELAEIVGTLGTWGQRWLPRHAESEDLDAAPLLLDMARRVEFARLPAEPLVVRFRVAGSREHFLLLRSAEAALCTSNPGFPEPLCVDAKLPALVAWWRGDVEFATARRMGLTVLGPRPLARAFPSWFARYRLAHVQPADGASR